MGRSRGGFSTKLHAVVDPKARPLHVVLTPGQQHESTVAEELMDHATGGAFIGDTGYDSVCARSLRVAEKTARNYLALVHFACALL